MPQTPDAEVVRTWCGLALRELGKAREEIDAINVYPVADGDTGTNLYLTVESAARAVEAVFAGHEAAGSGAGPSLAEAVRALAHGALIGACGNSGTILAQLLRGTAQVLAEAASDDGEHGADHSAPGPSGADGGAAMLRLALRRAAESGYQAVAHPVEGTVLTVATAAADAARRAVGDCAAVATAAYEGAATALEGTPDQLAVLGRAGVVDAGGQGLVAVLGALVQTLSGRAPARRPVRGGGGIGHHARVDDEAEPFAADAGLDEEVSPRSPAADAVDCGAESGADEGGPAFEVIYLLEADDAAVSRLRTRLDALGDSLVVVGGDGLWNVHVHVDDAGAAVEAGVEAGRPYRIRITHFGAQDAHSGGHPKQPRERTQRAIVVVVPGEGLAELCGESGATTVLARPGEPPASGELVDAIRRAHAREVVLLPNDPELRYTAAAAAEQARAEGVRVALIPTRCAVQGIAALAVHEPDRRFDEDVVGMTSAAGATRYAELAVAERQSWTTAGICQAGDLLGLIDGDVAVIGADVTATAAAVLDRMLSAGGEMVTLVLGDDLPESVGDALGDHVREHHLAVDTVVYRGGRQAPLMLIGVE
ncbi:DAK2 domain-containing protein [Streptomyces luteolus]|uniref:DAK2 domain-containing protein n=1 Tax=Streptomyces luteolus TaxID=3043615 RepID=A0ABT6T5L4_9ACTN|nr:DAK2 domain-containing protein [Streptomyces sp. B-S-A12]MDI3423135.1 DAK2 domain-containing protein [Streptomyces sp. B-S-A12]